MQEVKIQDLIVRCIEYFKEHCYTENRISKYKSLWRTGIVHFMTERSIVNYSPSIGADFVSSCHLKGEIRHQEREKIRSVQVLDDMLLLGIIRKRCFIPVHHSLDDEVGREMEKLITHLINLRRSQVTIKDYRLYLSELLAHLDISGVKTVEGIADKHILSFVSSHPTNKVNVVSALRVLFRFWKEEHIVNERFDDLFDTYKLRKKERIPSFYTAEEVATVENSVSRSSSVGKRNYVSRYLTVYGIKLLLSQPDTSTWRGCRNLALLSLMYDTGARVSEIADLTVDRVRITHEPYTIRLFGKGRKARIVPLVKEQMSILRDYMEENHLNDSNKTASLLFYNDRHEKLTREGITYILNTYVETARMESPELISGKISCHSIRHSRAMHLLQAGVNLIYIRDLLGHVSIQTTDIYARAESKAKREALEKAYVKLPPNRDSDKSWEGNKNLRDWLKGL